MAQGFPRKEQTDTIGRDCGGRVAPPGAGPLVDDTRGRAGEQTALALAEPLLHAGFGPLPVLTEPWPDMLAGTAPGGMAKLAIARDEDIPGWEEQQRYQNAVNQRSLDLALSPETGRIDTATLKTEDVLEKIYGHWQRDAFGRVSAASRDGVEWQTRAQDWLSGELAWHGPQGGTSGTGWSHGPGLSRRLDFMPGDIDPVLTESFLLRGPHGQVKNVADAGGGVVSSHGYNAWGANAYYNLPPQSILPAYLDGDAHLFPVYFWPVFAPDNPRLAALIALLDAEDYPHAIVTAGTLLESLPPAQLRDRADTHYCLAYALMLINDSERSQHEWLAAEDLYSSLGDRDWALRAATNQARLYERIGDFDRCQHVAERVIEAAQAEGHTYPLNYARLVMAYCHQRRRDYHAAEPLFQSAEPYFRTRGDDAFLLRCWEGLAWVWSATGRRPAARELEGRIIAKQRQRQNPIALATSLTAIGFGAWLDGDIERMRELLEETLAIASAHKHERLLMSTHNNLAMALVELGEWDAVRRHASLALLHAGRSGDNRRPPLAYGLQMHLALYESRPADAVHYADEAVFALREHGTAEAQQFARWRPVAHLAAGDLKHALEMWRDAAPPAINLEQIIQMRWLLRALEFIQSTRFRPEPALAPECVQQAAVWAGEVRGWLAAAQGPQIPERWRQP